MKQTLRTTSDIDRLTEVLRRQELPLEVNCKAYDEQSELQRKKLHAMLTDISKQVAWKGQKLNVLTWKRLCTAAMLRELGENPQLIPALDGNGFDVIYEKTSEMGKKKNAALIEWLYMFGAENNVVWKDPSDIIHQEV